MRLNVNQIALWPGASGMQGLGYRAFAMIYGSTKNGFVLLTNSARRMPLAAPLASSIVSAEHKVFRFQMLN
jgi:hypothetical protein